MTRQPSIYRTNGFTLAELVLVVGILSILIAITTLSLTSFQQSSSIDTLVVNLTSDLKQQQLKARIGETEGRTTSDTYGVYFNQNSYTLFHGTTFSAVNPDNQSISLDNGVSIEATTLPQNVIIFSRLSGEALNFINPSYTITLRHLASNATKTITINRLGTITAIN